MKKYQALFFDLDHTLWDFEVNSAEAISELFETYQLKKFGIPDAGTFMNVYREVNKIMWDEYHRNVISKESLRFGRFSKALATFSVKDDMLAEKMSVEYLEICPHKTNLFPGTLEVLEYLHEKFSMHIITNGFKEVQYLKIHKSGLEKYFDHIHISEEIGFKKPEPEIFEYAVRQARTVSDNCIMIGDNLDTDVKGAVNAGIDHVLFNPDKIIHNEKVMHEIHNLTELKAILIKE